MVISPLGGLSQVRGRTRAVLSEHVSVHHHHRKTFMNTRVRFRSRTITQEEYTGWAKHAPCKATSKTSYYQK